ncbi:hypothetical protein EDC31_1672 [Acidomonas methanolica]|nr:hypothetical protein EDC31_1672 [Acidomonas methanolica]
MRATERRTPYSSCSHAQRSHRRHRVTPCTAAIGPVSIRSPSPDYRTLLCKTHNTDVREVLYPWHPWFGRRVCVEETIERGGQVRSRCRLSDAGAVRLLELPAWMLDRAACAGMRPAPDPSVSLGALYDLRSLLTGFLSSYPSETVAGFSSDRNRREDHATRRTTALPCGDHIGAAGSVRRQEGRSALSEPDLEGPPPRRRGTICSR